MFGSWAWMSQNAFIASPAIFRLIRSRRTSPKEMRGHPQKNTRIISPLLFGSLAEVETFFDLAIWLSYGERTLSPNLLT
jgi:hypothetical protein